MGILNFNNCKIYYYLLIIYNLNLIYAQFNEAYDFRCSDGQIISEDEKCDGKINCKDGSDETSQACIHFECPKFAFRCAYGGCVKGKAECDGITDCADNSDENSIKCRKNSQSNPLASVNAGEECSNQRNTFKCANGDCISADSICDGIKDCADRSDESVGTCSSIECPSFAFRCGYGACIDRKLKCNQIENCADGSDEATILCGTADKYIISTSTTRRPLLTPKPPKPRTGCRVVNIPHLYFTFNDEIFSAGDYVESSVTVSYKCEPKYYLEGELENFCLNNQWQMNHPTCLKFCPSDHLQGVTFKADCKFQNLGIPCDQPLRPGTIAIISCQVGYEKPADTTTFPEVLTCDKSGNWDYSPARCFQSCGEEPIQLTPFIGGGETVQITSVPWQVAIYSNLESRSYQFICGGTIINPKIIISAAHCFYDDVSRKLYDRKYYTIAAGKSYRAFTHEKYSQFSNISEIHIPRLYVGLVGSFLNDLAIVILNNDLRFSNYIKPACIQWKKYTEQVVQTGISGRVAGWGTTTSGKVSETLQVLEVETLSHADCAKETKSGEPPTNDKFCIRNPSGAVCQGDSGGGFLVPEKLGNKKRYYLWGIVSHGTASQLLACSDNFITSFTNIQFFKEQIVTYLGMHNPK